MRKLSNNAFATLAMCEETKRCFGITVDKVADKCYSLIWAFPINRDQAHREGFDQTCVKGALSFDEDFPGCPYCGASQFYMCENCGTLVCYHGESNAICPNCGNKGKFHISEQFEIKGGSL